MRLAQQLYEGVDIKGNGTVGIITYLRTDSTRVSEEADLDVYAHKPIKLHFRRRYRKTVSCRVNRHWKSLGLDAPAPMRLPLQLYWRAGIL